MKLSMLFRPSVLGMSFVVTMIACVPAEGAAVSFAGLLEEMTDRDAAARWPQPSYTCGQFSSYDRGSTEPGTAGWWANQDRSHFLRVEQTQGRTEHVMMDADGPGAVVRLWATWHGPKGAEFSNGTIRVYLDHADEPTLAAPAREFIDQGYLAGPPLSQGVSPQTEYPRQGHNLYLPIPYGEHCKITYESNTFMDAGGVEGEAFYYQINYRRYQDDTQVETFSPEILKRNADRLAAAQRLLRGGPGTARGKTTVLTGTLAPDGELSAELKGAQAIRSLAFKLQADNLPQALRSVVLQIAFDGRRTVWCPIGDFFGTGYRLHPYRTWYTQVDKDGTLRCFWVMPFRERATVTLLNLGEQPVDVVTGTIITDEQSWDDRSLYFCAAWKQWTDIRTRSNPHSPDNGATDLNWVTITGRGKYVGDVLTLYNNAPSWWGEGDEKIYVDGEPFPSHFGTGTEDYYGYAWCRPAAFSAPFHAQPCGEGNLQPGYSVNSRFRALDAIPFEQGLRFDMELWHWAATQMDYAPTVFWYGDAETSCNIEPMPQQARRPVREESPAGRVAKKIDGAIEGETIRILDCRGGQAFVQQNEWFGWSDDRQLWWQDGRPGQTLVLEFEADRAGLFDIYAGLTKAPDYGMVELRINGSVLQDNLDLYAPQVTATEFRLGRARIQAGPNRLAVTITGANPKSIKRHMFGLDYIKLD